MYDAIIHEIWVKTVLEENLLITKSNERKSETVNGHTSRPYNSSGKHLLLIIFKVTSSML